MEEPIEEKDDSLAEDHSPTDEELSAAFDSFLGKEDVQVEEPEVIDEVEEPHEELTQGERTGLGRKVAKLHERLDNLSSGVATKADLLDILKRLDDIKNVTKTPHEEDFPSGYEEEEFHIETKDDLEKYLEKRERIVRERETETKRKYQDNYIDTMKELLSEIDDKTVAAKVYSELVKQGGEFNKIITGDPYKDCSRNFIKATRFVEKELNKTPFSRTVEDKKTGVSGGATTQTNKKVVPKLDEEAAEFARRMGMSEDDIIESLSKEVPMGLRR